MEYGSGFSEYVERMIFGKTYLRQLTEASRSLRGERSEPPPGGGYGSRNPEGLYFGGG